MKDYITFTQIVNSGPYPGMGSKEPIFESWCEVYEPSTKDIQLGSLETSTVNVTVIFRSAFPEFVPDVGNTFTLNTGMYKGTEFNIRTVSPKDENTMKIVGSKISE